MPWWSWILIWGGLVLLLLGVLVLGAVLVVRKAAALMPEVDRLEALQRELAELAEESVEPYRRRPVALLRGGRTVRQERSEFVDRRDERREAKRERKLDRAKGLIHADPMQFRHLVDTPKKG